MGAEGSKEGISFPGSLIGTFGGFSNSSRAASCDLIKALGQGCGPQGRPPRLGPLPGRHLISYSLNTLTAPLNRQKVWDRPVGSELAE